MNGPRTLGDLCEIDVGPAFASKSFSSEPTGPRLLRGDNIAQGRLRWDGAKYWPSGLVAGYERFALSEDDVILAMDRPWIEAGLKQAVVRTSDLPALLVQRVARLRARRGVDQRFLRWLIADPGFTAHIRAVSTGSTIPHISQTQIADYPVVRLPDIREQRAIGEVLGALDERIESNRRRASVAESLLDVLACAVVDRQIVPLGELVQVERKSCTPASYGETLVDHFSLPAFDASRLPDRTPGESIKSNKLVVTSGSVLVSRLNPATNRTWFAVPEPGIVAAASTEFMVLRPGKGIGIGAVWLAVRDDYFRSELARRATGTSGSHQRVRPDDALSIEVPDVRELGADANAEAEALLLLVHHARTESATLAELRDTLIPELLSGRLCAPVAEDLVVAAT
jgi:type I restriction enzyme S subunit